MSGQGSPSGSPSGQQGQEQNKSLRSCCCSCSKSKRRSPERQERVYRSWQKDSRNLQLDQGIVDVKGIGKPDTLKGSHEEVQKQWKPWSYKF